MAQRFYTSVGVQKTDSGFHVTLDGRILKTPGKRPLLCATEFQAKRVAAEWDAQIKEIKPETMPCTRLMNVACEMTPTNRPELIAEFKKYCETDLLCYRAKEPRDLAERQDKNWQPVLDWAAKNHDIALAVTDGLTAVPQAENSLNAAANIARNMSDIALTLLLHFTASYGSGILGLATVFGHLSAKRAFSLSKLDETFQNERWGQDEDAVARNAALEAELKSLAHLI